MLYMVQMMVSMLGFGVNYFNHGKDNMLQPLCKKYNKMLNGCWGFGVEGSWFSLLVSEYRVRGSV